MSPPPTIVRSYLYTLLQVASGLAALHARSPPLVHADLKVQTHLPCDRLPYPHHPLNTPIHVQRLLAGNASVSRHRLTFPLVTYSTVLDGVWQREGLQVLAKIFFVKKEI